MVTLAKLPVTARAGSAAGLRRVGGKKVLLISSLLLVSVAWVVCGCSQSRGSVATMALPDSELNQSQGPEQYVAPSQQQREYLDALGAAGVRTSSELSALTIGSYVCQARAAGQDDDAVWDFVEPLVRGDLDTSDQSSSHPAEDEVEAATASYIRIATERLC